MNASALCLLLALCLPSATPDTAGLIPLPAQVEADQGRCPLGKGLNLVHGSGDPQLARTAGVLAGQFKGDGFPATKSLALMVRLSRDSADSTLGDGGYELRITPEGAAIRAAGPAGLFYGGQTLRQLLRAHRDEGSLPCLRIVDTPRFPWRGLMLDCSRTFLSVDYLRRYVDLLAEYKMNVLHLHLTDDQGWRMEIKSHPELTAVGANFDPAYPNERNGFYTQAELRDLVRYAADRHVTLVPEIEMPSHCLAALVAMPDLSCRGDAYRVVPFSDMLGPEAATPYGVFCAGNDRTFEVLEDVLAEVIDVFPSRLIHIGGDECPKEFWKGCPKCQARMKAEGLKDENELQSYFVKRMERFINGRGRVLLGWDEILEGGLAPNASVMSWRGVAGGIEAARAGHDVVMSPTTHCYLDYDHTAISVEHIYSFEPVPAELTAEQGRLVLGAQGNMWTHIARTEPDIDAQILPRLIALSEATWSPREARDWAGFQARLEPHYARLEAQGFSYYRETPIPSLAIAPDGRAWVVQQGKVSVLDSGEWRSHSTGVTQVAFAADGTAYGVSAEPRPVLRWTESEWKPLEGAPVAVSLTVGLEGELWAVTEDHSVYVRRGDSWEKTPDRLRRLMIASDGSRWALGETALAGGYDVLEWKDGSWKSLGNGSAAAEGAAIPGALWVVNGLGVTFVRSNDAWSAIASPVRALAAGPDDTLWGLAPEQGGRAWRLQKREADQWTPQGPPLAP